MKLIAKTDAKNQRKKSRDIQDIPKTTDDGRTNFFSNVMRQKLAESQTRENFRKLFGNQSISKIDEKNTAVRKRAIALPIDAGISKGQSRISHPEGKNSSINIEPDEKIESMKIVDLMMVKKDGFIVRE